MVESTELGIGKQHSFESKVLASCIRESWTPKEIMAFGSWPPKAPKDLLYLLGHFTKSGSSTERSCAACRNRSAEAF